MLLLKNIKQKFCLLCSNILELQQKQEPTSSLNLISDLRTGYMACSQIRLVRSLVALSSTTHVLE